MKRCSTSFHKPANQNTLHKQQRGAALLVVIVVALVLSLLITAANTVLSQRLALATAAKDKFNQQVAVHTKLNELIYLAATQRITRAGVSQGKSAESLKREEGRWLTLYTGDEIRVDSHLYSEEINGTPITFQLQAENGLIPVNTSNPFWLNHWLKTSGVSTFERTKLIDTLADYADKDDWSRPAGAEKHSYQRAGKKPPANYLLQHCNELKRILHWQPVIMSGNIDLKFCSTSRSTKLNLNAIPESLASTLFTRLSSGLQRRKERNEWFLSPGNASAYLSELLAVPEDYLAVMAGNDIYINVSSEYVTKSVQIETGKGELPPFTTKSR